MKFNIEALKTAFFKLDKKASNLIFLFLLGIALLIFSNIFMKNKEPDDKTSPSNIPSIEESNASNDMSYEVIIEDRLKKVLKKVEGVGDVDIMLTISYGRELIIAEDYKSTTDKEQSESIEKKTVIINQNNTNEPLVVKEIEPKIEGVVIVAQGGDNIIIKEQLTRAAQALLNIPVHKIEILKMK